MTVVAGYGPSKSSAPQTAIGFTRRGRWLSLRAQRVNGDRG